MFAVRDSKAHVIQLQQVIWYLGSKHQGLGSHCLAQGHFITRGK